MNFPTKYSSIRTILALWAGLLPGLCLSQGVQFATPVNQAAVTSKQATSRLDKLKKNPQRVIRGVVRLDRSALDSNWIAFTIPGGETYQIQDLRKTILIDAVTRYEGLVAQKEGTKFAIYVKGDSMYGMLSTLDHEYSIEQIEGDMYSVSETDRTRPPPNAEGPAGLPATPPHQLRKHDPASSATSKSTTTAQTVSANPVIDILVLTTAEVSLVDANLSLAIPSQIDQLASHLSASQTGVSVRHVGTRSTTFTERVDLPVNSRLGAELDGIIAYPQAQQLRNALEADIVVLVSSSGGFEPNYCGWAKLRAAAEAAYVAISSTCLTYPFIFSHEVGHIFGADHNIENQTPGNTIPYAHGTRNLGNLPERNCYFTIMAYVVTCVGFPVGTLYGRLPVFSSPSLYSYFSLGNSATQDNSRVIREQANAVASFRGGSSGGGGGSSGGNSSAIGAVIVPLILDAL